MCEPVSMGIMAAAAIGNTVVQANAAKKQEKQMKQATQEAKAASDKQASLMEQELNKQKARAPGIAGFKTANAQAGQAGMASTMVSGVGGVDPSSLLLGKNTLLGQ